MFLKQKVTTPCARVGKNEILKLGMRGGECVEGVYCERKDLFEPFFEGVVGMSLLTRAHLVLLDRK